MNKKHSGTSTIIRLQQTQKDNQMKLYSQGLINLEINNGNCQQLKLLRVMRKNITIDSGI